MTTPLRDLGATTSASPRGLERWGEWCARRPWWVIGSWLLTLVVVALVSGTMHTTFVDNVSLAGTQAATGQDVLLHDGARTPASVGLLVFASSAPVSTYESDISRALSTVHGATDVASVSDPFSNHTVSADGRIAYSSVGFTVGSRELPRSLRAQLDQAFAPVRATGVRVSYGGALDQVTTPTLNDRTSEMIGFAVALIVLLGVFGSLLGAVVPLGIALVSIVAGISLLDIVGSTLAFGASAPKLAAMIGIGVGIDYAVFFTTRFRQYVREGVAPARAAGLTTASSGRAIVVAATTVSLAMVGLYASGVTFIGLLGLAAVFGVATAAVGAVTLVPAVLGLIGVRIDRLHVGRTVAESGSDTDAWHRYAAAIGRRPWTYLGAGLVVLALIAAPALSLSTGHVGDGANPTSYTSRQAYDTLARGFGAGVNGPFTIVVARANPSTGMNGAESSLRAALLATNDVASVSPVTLSPNGSALVSTLVPRTGPQSASTAALFTRLLEVTLPRALKGTGDTGYVTGVAASQIQFDQLIAQRIPLIIAVVVVLAFLLIMTVFRSLFLALKAAMLNLLSIAAAYGVLVAVFQWGWGRSLLGLDQNVPVEAYVPMLLFAIVFGLSMDYEIFLLSRVKETWDLTGDNHDAVATGLSRTGRVISAAAMIMVSVFLSFVTSDLVAIKQLAVGLAASVAIDATLIRLLLVPATMFLFGNRNWWLPGWLDRVLPRITVE
ncbi:MAG: MMPL family transporter [Acidobacteriota bacterium]|nr:MMPL family transporter [Acidobacteriota bacterium]MDE3147434.1 MMPL family transporter [Acidobacteriota bacterium]